MRNNQTCKNCEFYRKDNRICINQELNGYVKNGYMKHGITFFSPPEDFCCNYWKSYQNFYCDLSWDDVHSKDI